MSSCATNPYTASNRIYKKQTKELAKSISQIPVHPTPKNWVGTTNFSLRKPNYVIIHHTAQNSTEQTLKTFTLPQTQVSAHYVIGKDGKIYHMLNDYLRAWHGGASKWGNATDLNSSSIGIELDNNGYEAFAEPQISSLLQVLATLKKDYSIPTANFIGHSELLREEKWIQMQISHGKNFLKTVMGYGLILCSTRYRLLLCLPKPFALLAMM